ncbi:hypothetical protein [Bdellovibrio sp. GT3]|uniref:hypothetical protein n=1 Tax=Bdellovibrio sp. GT3 TaxID=3136282 RepID=UPI0030F036AA
MIKRLKTLLITTSLMLLGAFAHAQESDNIRELVFNGRVNGRSSPEFTKASRNILSTVPTGSKAEVVTTTRMNSPGSYAVQVRITKLGKGKSKTKVGDVVWVYYNKKNPWLKFRDGEDMELQNPENALAESSRKSGDPQPSPPSNEDKSVDPNEAMPDSAKTEAGMGGNCKLNGTCGSSETNRNDLQNIATKALDDAAKKKPKENSEIAAATKSKKTNFDLYKKRKYTMTEHEWKNFPTVTNYSNSSKVAKTIKAGVRNKEPHSTGWCYSYVKTALQSGGLVKSRPPGGFAKNAVRDLKAQGFVNLMDEPYKGIIKSPDDAPKGAVLVYETSDKRQAGDVQIKTEWGTNGGYVSDFLSDNSFLSSPKARRFKANGKPYRIIGVMIKP